MNNQYLNISAEPIKRFLDAVDSVLNSNTFLLEFELNEKQITSDLLSFITSDSFINELARQDLEREWLNLSYFDEQTNKFQIRQGDILNGKFELKAKQIIFERLEYLMAMLTADSKLWKFRSYHSQQLDHMAARTLANNLISFLCDCEEWHLYSIEPNFLKIADNIYPIGEEIRYFELLNSNNTATVIECKKKGFLLLTNGIP